MAKEKILVVDDEKAINKLVCSYLTKEQFRPFPAYTGEEALDLLKKENPDLIILDIMLPDTEGTALSLDIREHSNAPIIFLSCKTQEIDKIIALSAGGDDYQAFHARRTDRTDQGSSAPPEFPCPQSSRSGSQPVRIRWA